jgi:predicted Holliday junction resolvase-like endonuclease
MTEKEMIEELAHTLYCKQDKFDLSNPFEVAKAVVEEGYRKIPEGGAILSKEENEKWVEWLEMNIKKARKETARKFASFVKSKLFDLGNIVNERDIDDMLKEFQ